MYNSLPGQYEWRTGDLTESVRDAPRPAPRPPFLKDDILLSFLIILIIHFLKDDILLLFFILIILNHHHQPRACHPSGWVW